MGRQTELIQTETKIIEKKKSNKCCESNEPSFRSDGIASCCFMDAGKVWSSHPQFPSISINFHYIISTADCSNSSLLVTLDEKGKMRQRHWLQYRRRSAAELNVQALQQDQQQGKSWTNWDYEKQIETTNITSININSISIAIKNNQAFGQLALRNCCLQELTRHGQHSPAWDWGPVWGAERQARQGAGWRIGCLSLQIGIKQDPWARTYTRHDSAWHRKSAISEPGGERWLLISFAITACPRW